MRFIVIALLCLCVGGCRKTDDPLTSSPDHNGDYISAGYKLKEVESYADSYSEKCKLMSVRSYDVDYYGLSKRWTYTYMEPYKSYYFSATKSTVTLDSISTIVVIGPAAITNQWMNSNEILAVAEEHGGREFRTNNKNYTITAILSESMASPKPETSWYIAYIPQTDASKRFMVVIDAPTGIVLSGKAH